VKAIKDRGHQKRLMDKEKTKRYKCP